MCTIRVSAYSNTALWERFYVYANTVVSNGVSLVRRLKECCDGDFESSHFDVGSHQDLISLSGGDQSLKSRNVKFYLVLNALEFSYFIYLLRTSRTYRNHIINYWSHKVKSTIPKNKMLTLNVSLSDPPQQVIDHKW